jgi:hypothetical protein
LYYVLGGGGANVLHKLQHQHHHHNNLSLRHFALKLLVHEASSY